MSGFLITNNREECFGCEACSQICNQKAITMQRDNEGFFYPRINKDLCTNCDRCRKICPKGQTTAHCPSHTLTFGGYIKDPVIRGESTSGGLFSAIATSWCDDNYVIFGAASDGLNVFHTFITDKKHLARFRKSKYRQSQIGTSYQNAANFLKSGKKVLFSGTPCQIAGLNNYLKSQKITGNLLTVEVICEGVPSPLYMEKYDQHLNNWDHSHIVDLDYRYKDGHKWDFEVMLTRLTNGRILKKDRWFNPFWSIWLNHLMSRPSCYKCPFATDERVADITLGDLWGVHIYCPELYGNNGGASLAICNTEIGVLAFQNAQDLLFGHELDFNEALKYQSPLRGPIKNNEKRMEFMNDLMGPMDYKTINNKWAKKPTFKLLWQKYVWGNRQKVFYWNMKNKLFKRKRNA